MKNLTPNKKSLFIAYVAAALFFLAKSAVADVVPPLFSYDGGTNVASSPEDACVKTSSVGGYRVYWQVTGVSFTDCTNPAYYPYLTGGANLGGECLQWVYNCDVRHLTPSVSCPSTYTLNTRTLACSNGAQNESSPAKNLGKPDFNSCQGNPCNAGSGNKYQREIDYIGNGQYPLQMVRTYNSGSKYPVFVELTYLGSQWRSIYNRRISTGWNVGVLTATLKRPDGKSYYFTRNGSNFVGDADVVGRLAPLGVDASGNPTGWAYRNEDEELESYDALGKLISITSQGGLVHTLTYSDNTAGPTEVSC